MGSYISSNNQTELSESPDDISSNSISPDFKPDLRYSVYIPEFKKGFANKMEIIKSETEVHELGVRKLCLSEIYINNHIYKNLEVILVGIPPSETPISADQTIKDFWQYIMDTIRINNV
jgi:hypothetical protein